MRLVSEYECKQGLALLGGVIEGNEHIFKIWVNDIYGSGGMSIKYRQKTG